ncbi:hypothetical protein LY13_004471 [Prauserella aidingensis]|uniref:hypothetical protein n=1 Tax=Prauserella aidingensis TaxID=387890 RepID=UPI0020A2D4A7|nr:hypothetical protein [Prauserella aidingensis]MCP2255690.1 hypothetical protein [Prauserella aidingensis]
MDSQVFAGPGSVPHMVEQGLGRTRRAYVQAQNKCVSGRCGTARKMGRIAELYEREARWWGVLSRWTSHQRGIQWIYTTAAISAEHDAERRAESYREMEASYWRRALAVAADSGVAA